MSTFSIGQHVTIVRPVGAGAQHYKGLRARVLGSAPRTLGRPGDVYHVAFMDARLPINDTYFDAEEMEAAS